MKDEGSFGGKSAPLDYNRNQMELVHTLQLSFSFLFTD
jgi:hypothetical protein